MNAERLKLIEEIYHAVLEIPFDERENFFKKHCGDDAELRREVESLLSFEKSSANFLDAPPESLAAEMFSAEENHSSLIGTQIGRYRIEKILGKGGMGEVYLAEDTTLNRKVALKFLPAAISADKNRLRRFEQEALSASALNHPNILTIYEFGSDNGTYFLAAEFVEGETVRELVNRKEISLKEILQIAEQTAFALAAAHRSGIIHRDIKPDNIMRREDGIVKILDFGLAKLAELSAELNANEKEASTRKFALTNPGMVMGTAAYMSPEQTRGLSDVDARTDIWSLGVVIFEMITGRTPFAGETISDIIASILKTDAPHLSNFIPNCPPELDRIVTKALKKDREERYQVMKDLALDLKSLRREQEFSVEFERPTDGAEKNLTMPIPKQAVTTAVESHKRFSIFQLVSILFAAALVFGGAWWYFAGNNKTGTAAETAAPLRTVEVANWSSSPGEIYSVGSFSPDAKMIAFASTRSGGKNIWVKQTVSGEAIQITKDEFGNDDPLWSPNGDELAFYSTKGGKAGIWRIPGLGGSAVFVAEIKDGSSQLKFWSKQNLIYYESKGEILAADINSGQITPITDFAAKNIKANFLNASHDEKQIAYVTNEDKTWILWAADLNGNSPRKLFSGTNEIRNVVWHPDNRRIFFNESVDDIFQIFVTDIDGAQPRQITSAETDYMALDVSSDGTKILYGAAKEESDIWGVNLKDSKEFSVAASIDSELWADVSPDGKFIAYQSIKNLSQGNKLASGNIVTRNLADKEKETVIVSNAALPEWSPDGKMLAFVRLNGDKYQIGIVSSAGGGQKMLGKEGVDSASFTVLPYNRIQESYISWSPDNQKIAYVADSNQQDDIWLTNTDGSNDEKLTNNESNLIFSCPLWSADGKRIAFTAKTNNLEGKPTYSVSVIDLETKKIDPIFSENTFVRLVGWTQSGKELILASVEGSGAYGSTKDVSLFQLEVETKKMSEIVKLKETYLYNIHLSADKKTIAFAAHRDGADNLWLIPATGGAEKKLTNNNDSRLYFSSLAWSPDGNFIFFGKQSRYSLLSMLTNFK